MALQTNACGLSYTATSLDCVSDFEQVVTAYLASSNNTMSLLDALLSLDPDMPMAVCLRGYLLRLVAHPPAKPQPAGGYLARWRYNVAKINATVFGKRGSSSGRRSSERI